MRILKDTGVPAVIVSTKKVMDEIIKGKIKNNVLYECKNTGEIFKYLELYEILMQKNSCQLNLTKKRIRGLKFEVGYSRAPPIGPGPPIAAWRKFGRAILSRNSSKTSLHKAF